MIRLLPLLFVLPIFAQAQNSNELLVGSLTYHLYGMESSEFANKLNPSGDFIANPMIGFRQTTFDATNSYESWAAFGGENSIGDGMLGAAMSAGIGDKTLRLGLIAGTYLQNNSQFYDKGLTMVGAPVSSTMELTPLLGFEFVYNIDLTPRTYFTINQILSPWLYTAAVGIGWRL